MLDMFLLLAVQAGPAPAACAATPVVVGAASAPDIAGGAPLAVGTLATVNMWSSDQISLAVPRGTPSASTYGGSMAFEAPVPGVYLFQSDTAITLDLVKGTGAFQPEGKPTATCPGFGFAAAYKLDAGRYVVQVAMSPSASIKLLASR